MQRYFAKMLDKNNVVLEDTDYHHIKNVIRMKNNDNIEIVYDGVVYLSIIKDISNNIIEIVDKIDINNELDINLVVAIGLVKEQKMDLILQKLTELGVSEIIPLKLSRSIVKLDDKKSDKKNKRWNIICKEASEQSKRNRIPIVHNPLGIKELVKLDSDLKLVASTKFSSELISNYIDKNNKYSKILVVIGPEGGFSEDEEEYLNNNNFVSVSFGKRVLRVETAAIYIASIINYIRM